MKIIIVEDEIRIRQGIEKLISKIAPESEIVACAEDGQEGMEKVLEFHPDLVITDIRMPKMDGLEMLSALKDKRRLPETIVISAYSEFEYARRAIRLGVSEYILKPISVTEFTNVFRKIENQVKIKKEKENLQSQSESFEMIMEQELYYGNIINKHLKSVLWNKYQFNADSRFSIIVVYAQNEKIKKSVRRDMETLWENYKDVDIKILQKTQEKTMVVFLYNYSDEKNLERWFQNRVASDLAKEYADEVCFGWGEIASAEGLKGTYKAILNSMDWNIILGKGVLVSYPKVTMIQVEPVIYPITIEQEMRESLCMMDGEMIEKKEKKFTKYFRRGVVHSPREVKDAFVRFTWAILNIVKEIDFNCYEQFDQSVILDRIMTAVTFRALEEPLEEVVQLIIECGMKDVSEDSLTIIRMKNMVHEFYNRGITLDEIAEELQMTPEYLGTQFRKEVGVTYSMYLKQYRIEKAKKLLIGTDLKMYEVAQKVGYSDPKYFSKVFKELEGELPGDYKKRH